MKFRLLKADEISVRVAKVSDKGCSLLLYKNARVDMDMLDETLGSENWQRKHYECKGNLFCSIGIKTNDDWIWKDDCGAESYAEKEKGEASDSFKRACVNLGIGRELYTAPFIWVPADKVKLSKGNNGKYSTYDKFSVEKIAYNETSRIITGLSIKNNRNERVFVWQADKT